MCALVGRGIPDAPLTYHISLKNATKRDAQGASLFAVSERSGDGDQPDVAVGAVGLDELVSPALLLVTGLGVGVGLGHVLIGLGQGGGAVSPGITLRLQIRFIKQG